MATWMRFELTTSAVTGRHSNQLNYQAIYDLLIISIFESPSHLVFLLRKTIPWRVLHQPHGLVFLLRKTISWRVLHEPDRLACTSCNHSMEGALLAARACLLVEVTGLEPVTPCL